MSRIFLIPDIFQDLNERITTVQFFDFRKFTSVDVCKIATFSFQICDQHIIIILSVGLECYIFVSPKHDLIG